MGQTQARAQHPNLQRSPRQRTPPGKSTLELSFENLVEPNFELYGVDNRNVAGLCIRALLRGRGLPFPSKSGKNLRIIYRLGGELGLADRYFSKFYCSKSSRTKTAMCRIVFFTKTPGSNLCALVKKLSSFWQRCRSYLCWLKWSVLRFKACN